MKTKLILLLAFCSLFTLSFSFISVNASKSHSLEIAKEEGPIGGFVIEDKLDK
jgi:hypothetical protein